MKPPIKPDDLVCMKNDAAELKKGENVRVAGFRPTENYPVKVESTRPSSFSDGPIRVWVGWHEIRRLKDDE